jgi:microcystin-dependent protein
LTRTPRRSTRFSRWYSWGATISADPPKDPHRLFITPDAEPPTCYIFRRLSIPDDLDWIALVNGALSTLTSEHFWQQRADGQTIETTIEVFTEMWLDYVGEAENMIGAVFSMAADVLPANMLWCDGTTYNRVDYPDLYGRLAAAFIIDADTFSVPDLRGRVVVGSGPGAGLTDRAVGDTGGEEEHQLTVGELASHNHGVYADHFIHSTAETDVPILLSESILTITQTDYAGSDEAHNNMQPYFALRFAIVAKSRDAC